ncbi:Glycoprotein-N-acetylgalactosamine 3-beta-galactosyltransferase 1-A [Lamellibrachia satsuma]|nr:Glycoprotein-N-acetylgalactosamine 3-beta-galactosyltransferase 1-A [Lamellibrachia satsuma]
MDFGKCLPGADVTDDIIANELSKKVRILCWIMTAPQFLQTKARHVRATWGRRCNVLLFASDYENRNFSTIDIHVQPGRDHLTAKSMQVCKTRFNKFQMAKWTRKPLAYRESNNFLIYV